MQNLTDSSPPLFARAIYTVLASDDTAAVTNRASKTSKSVIIVNGFILNGL